MNKVLKFVLPIVVLMGLQACTTQRNNESYKQAAISECSKQPTPTAYNDCVDQAKMEAEVNRINSQKHQND